MAPADLAAGCGRPWRTALAGDSVAPVIPLVLAIAAFGLASPTFLSTGTAAVIVNTVAFVGVVAVGQTLLISSGEFDLSVGANAGLSGWIAANLIADHGWNIVAALAAALTVGLALGLVNGVVTTMLRVPSFIATIGTLYIVRGLSDHLSRGETVFPLPRALTEFGATRWASFSWTVFVLLGIALAGQAVLSWTMYGRHLLASGANPEAARVAGIDPMRTKLVTFLVVGGLAACAGVMQMVSLGAGNPKTGSSWELLSVAAVVIGGTSLFGGKGSIITTLVGVVTLQTLSVGIIAVGAQTNWQGVGVGVLMVAMVSVDLMRRRATLGERATR